MAWEPPPAGPHAVVSLLTDFGLADGFVGAVHSVILSRARGARIVDLTHLIAPFDIRAGSRALLRAAPYMAPGVVVAVVDPGVGTSRRAVAVASKSGAHVYVGPDNGLLSAALEADGGAGAAVELTDRGYWARGPGPTFAGRDIFAPAAAELVLGRSLLELGRSIDPASLTRLPGPLCRTSSSGRLEVEVTWADRFGNVQLAARPQDVPWATAAYSGPGAGTSVLVRRLDKAGSEAAALGHARLARTFGDLADGELGLIVDSYGHLALVLAGASASRALSLGEGDTIALGAPPA